MPKFKTDKFRTLVVDPGESTGWSVWKDNRLLGAGTTPMWDFADMAWAGVALGEGLLGEGDHPWLREDVDPKENSGYIGRIVCEDWRLYPEKLKSLAWDQCRTARLIGALTFIARTNDIDFDLQGANIKKQAVAAGAEELFYQPLHENRHQNDSIMHGVFFFQIGRHIV